MSVRRVIVACFAMLLVASVGVTPAVAQTGGEEQFAVFTFGSFEDHGDFIHCSVSVTRSPSESSELIPSDETCFEDEADAVAFALGGGPAANQSAMQYSARNVVPDGLIAIHYAGRNFSGASFAIAGVDCDGGGITLTGGAWDNRIDSTANGCSRIEHYDVSTDGVFEGDMEATTEFGGNLSNLRNRTSGTLYEGTLAKRVDLVGLEVTQGLQDWEGNAQLVRGRPTVVRAFFEERSLTSVVARLYMDFDNGSTAGPLTPLNSGGRVLAFSDVQSRRASLSSSLNFRLPTSWTESDGTLRIEVLGGGAKCLETRFPAYTCTAEMSYVDVAVPRVRMVAVAVDGRRGLEMLTIPQLDEQAARIMSGLPISGLDYDNALLMGRFAANPTLDEVNLALLAARVIDGSTAVYLGPLESGSGGSAGSVPSNSAVGRTDGTTGHDDGGYYRNIMVHEFAHTFGTNHAKEDIPENSKHTMCGGPNKSAGTSGPYFYAEYKVEYFDLNGDPHDRAVLGPITNASAEDDPWGLDYRYLSNIGSPLLVIDPFEVGALMSYCRPPDSSSQGKWIDMQYWPYIIDLINDVDWVEGPVDETPGDTDLFLGTLVLTDGVATEAEFAPVLRLQTATTAQPDGPYRLELLDSAGISVATQPFAVYSSEAEVDQNGDEEPASSMFAVTFADPPAYESFRIVLDGNVIDSVVRSANAPTVSVTGPQVGDVFDSDTVTLSWSASDVDGDDLSYLVQYSVDGGTTFETIAVDYDLLTLVVDRSMIDGSSQAMFRVTVSDGTRSASADSPIFNVVGNAPRLSVLSPASDEVFSDLQGIVFEGSAVDNEDGQLADASISWSSDIDGPLGTGALVIHDASALTAGEHLVTVTATDSSGLVTTESVRIVIGERNEPPVVIDDEAFVELGASVDIDVLANDSDVEDDLAGATLSIALPPTLGTAEVQSTTGAGYFIRYTAGIAGTDTFGYEVCDNNGQCGTATVTIVVGTDDCTIVGTNGPDILIGTSGNDVICGLGGNDTIDGRGGDDVIRGGSGADILKGGPGDDVIFGGRGADTIRGQAGQDRLFGGRGADLLFGGAGNDEIHGSKGGDTIKGGAGNDTIFGGQGPDVVDGGAGADVLHGNRGSDTLRGGTGADEIFGGREADQIYGGPGRDWLYGRRGRDHIEGGNGADMIFGNRGADELFGGRGRDVIRGGRGSDTANGGPGRDVCFAEVSYDC